MNQLQKQFNEQLFSKSFHSKLKFNVEKEYFNFIEDIREDLKKGFTTDIVDSQFLDQLNDIIHDENFDKYSPLKFYWMNLVDNLIYIIQLHEEILNADEYNEGNEELSLSEEELLTLWSESELSKMFLDILDEGLPVLEASDQLIPLLENQIISFYVLHINQFQQEFDDAIVYQAIKELGDFEKRIYLGDKHFYVDLNTHPDNFPTLPIKSIKPSDSEITIEVKEEDVSYKIKNNPLTLKIDNQIIFLLPSCEVGIKKFKTLLDNLENALKKIKIANPKLLDTFLSFTHSIVPIDEEGIISYSIQSLPGYTCLNMFNRDQIDLMGDLIHENAHHYLNTYLNHQDLINEDDESIYFSPWKRALKPIRNIYHSVFTFYWELELHHSLLKASDSKKLKFSPVELLKIKSKLVEEYYNLSHCTKEIESAFKDKKITKAGIDLIRNIFANVAMFKDEVLELEADIKANSDEKHEYIQFVKKNLDKAAKEHAV